MARPLSPTVVGPLSEWSASLRVDGCVPGAMVTVRSLTRPGGGVVASGPAADGSVRLVLAAGVRLAAKDRLVALQDLDGEASVPPGDALAVTVAPAPTTSAGLPHPAIVSHLWEFGRAMQVAGALPGAVVTISSPAGTLGQAVADEGLARITLAAALPPAGTKVVVDEGAPPGFALAPPLQTSGTVNGLPVPIGGAFPRPGNPQAPGPAGCDPAVLIGSVFDGASVTVTATRDGVPDARLFDLDQLWFVLRRPLDSSGEKLEVTQGMARSERAPSPPLLISADAAPEPGPPLLSPPCPGSEWLGVAGLLPGADLTVQVDDEVYAAGRVAPDATSVTLGLPPVAPGANITVTQQRCGLSASASIAAQDLVALGDPDLGDRPIECAYRVRVVSATPGALLELRAQRRGVPAAPIRVISARVFVTSPVVHLAVSPALSTQDEIWVAQLTCTDPWTEGPRHPVESVPSLDPPDLLFPPILGESSVRVSAMPGAVVEVFLWLDDGPRAFLGAGPVDPDADWVPVYRAFAPGDRVVLLQRFCSHFSALGAPSRTAMPGIRVFELPVGQDLSYPSEGGHDVRCAALGVPAVTMTCWADGRWLCTANVTNTQPGGVCTFTLTFTAEDDQGVIFSKALDGEVIPPNSGLFDDHGVPLRATRHVTWPWKPLHPPLEPSFADVATWERLLTARGTFAFAIAVWGTEPITPELVEDQLPPP